MQLLAILIDSLRELRSRSLFWLTIGLSAIVAIALFGLIRFDENGWGILWLSTNQSDVLTSGSYAATELLSWLFGGAFVYWWLSWGTIIVALLSTASIMPDFVASGSIDLAVAKPISRIKLFLIKLLGALLFMLVQVTIGVLLAYLLIGLRFDIWFHASLWSIPLLTLQFLYLYSVMALVGVITRSPLAGLLIVLVFWVVISLVQFAANQVTAHVAEAQETMVIHTERIAEIEAAAADGERELTSAEVRHIQRSEVAIDSSQSVVDMLDPWKARTDLLVLFVPKTADIQKIIAESVEAPTFNELIMILGGADADTVAMASEMQDAMRSGAAASRAVREVEMSRSLGTSLAFTSIVLLWATWLFYRRDF